MKPLLPYVPDTRVEPSGASNDTLARPIEPALRARLTRSPPLPVKASRAFWPGTPVLTVTGAPPGLIVYAGETSTGIVFVSPWPPAEIGRASGRARAPVWGSARASRKL